MDSTCGIVHRIALPPVTRQLSISDLQRPTLRQKSSCATRAHILTPQESCLLFWRMSIAARLCKGLESLDHICEWLRGTASRHAVLSRVFGLHECLIDKTLTRPHDRPSRLMCSGSDMHRVDSMVILEGKARPIGCVVVLTL